MRKRVLGRTGLEVSELGLGGLFVSSYGSAFEQANLAVNRALELGINYVDTAPTYANSEEVLGLILEHSDMPCILQTKLGGRPHPFRPQQQDDLLKSVEESLKLLKRSKVDILMIHEPDRPGEYDWWSDKQAYYGPVLEVLDQLRKDGVIRFTGLGGTTAYEMIPIIQTGKFDVILTAFNYDLLWREAELGILPAAIEQNMGIVIGSPLHQGALARRLEEIADENSWVSPPRRQQFRALYKLVDETGIPLPELALRFVLSNPHVSCTLTGVRSVAEVEQNVKAAEQGPLSPDVMARIDEIAAMVPFRPCEEPFLLPFGKSYKGPGQAR